MIIGTFNIKDSKENNKSDNIKKIASIINENKFDILGTQELTHKNIKRLKKHLNNYEFYGKYRYKNMSFIPYNECNKIITKEKIVKSKTIWLPFFKSIFNFSFPRIVTMVILENKNNKKICMMNTHLENSNKIIRYKQLDVLKKLVIKYGQKYDIILCGDFNMQEKNEKMISFINETKKIIKLVKLDGNTWYSKNNKGKKIDHIFIPVNWKIKTSRIIDSKKISDHNLLVVEVEN